MRRRVITASLLLLAVGMLAACGQKGALFLPTRPATSAPASAASVTPPAAQPATGQR